MEPIINDVNISMEEDLAGEGMCEVTKSNFKELYPKIEKSLKKAAFIAIDCEFSGLVSHARLKNSLFDSPAERYLKLKASIEQFTIFQCGLAIFHYNRDDNKYSADVYSFYTFPASFGPVENCFLCQPTSWEFLRAHNFNFNKVAYEGIPFLNSTKEAVIRRTLFEGTMMSNLERSLSYCDEDALQEACSQVSERLSKDTHYGASIEINVQDTNYCLIYFLHKEIRTRFKEVWTFKYPGKIVAKKLRPEEKGAALSAEGEHLDTQLVDSLVGFGKVFRLLGALKKPLVGHNLLLDLMILYHQMYLPLPSSYSAFKKELNILFPSIHDTKFISYQVREILRKQDHWRSNRLDVLYTFLHNEKGRSMALCSPKIEVEGSPVQNVEEHLHEAAWDAYMSGYCFVRLAHYLAIRRLGEDAVPRPLSRVEHLSAVAEYRNCINIIRASVSYMNIGGEDPQSRTKLLYVTRRDQKPIDIYELTAMMALPGLSAVDVKSLTKTSALVAVSNQYSARDIVQRFIKDKEFKVVPYSYLRHTSYLKTFLWSSIFFSSVVCVGAVITSALSKK